MLGLGWVLGFSRVRVQMCCRFGREKVKKRTPWQREKKKWGREVRGENTKRGENEGRRDEKRREKREKKGSEKKRK